MAKKNKKREAKIKRQKTSIGVITTKNETTSLYKQINRNRSELMLYEKQLDELLRFAALEKAGVTIPDNATLDPQLGPYDGDFRGIAFVWFTDEVEVADK